MRIYCIIILFCLVALKVTAQEKQGQVISADSSTPIEATHIVNISTNKMAITNDEGYFSLVAGLGDTLVASNVNFKTKYFVVGDEEILRITLNPAVIQLDEVRVSNMPESEHEFKRRLVNMGEIEENTIEIDGLMPVKEKGKIPKNYDPHYTNSLGYAINKPISFIVKKFSKSHKNKLKYYRTVANQANSISNNKKYNAKIVNELTNLEGDELADFIQFLDLDSAFVKRATEYEIAVRILDGFEAYKTQKG